MFRCKCWTPFKCSYMFRYECWTSSKCCWFCSSRSAT